MLGVGNFFYSFISGVKDLNMKYMYMKNRRKKKCRFFMTKTDQFLTVYSLYSLKVRNFLHFFIYILYVSWDITNNINLFLTVCDISLMVWEEKLKFFLLLLRTKCHKVGLVIITVGPSDMDPMNGFGVDEQLVHFGVHLSQGPNVFGTQCPWTEMCGSKCH